MADLNHLQKNRKTPLDATCLLNNTVGENYIGAPNMRSYFSAIIVTAPHLVITLSNLR